MGRVRSNLTDLGFTVNSVLSLELDDLDAPLVVTRGYAVDVSWEEFDIVNPSRIQD